MVDVVLVDLPQGLLSFAAEIGYGNNAPGGLLFEVRIRIEVLRDAAVFGIVRDLPLPLGRICICVQEFEGLNLYPPHQL